MASDNPAAIRQAAAQRAAMAEQMAIKTALNVTSHGHTHRAKSPPGLVSTLTVIAVLALAIASFVAVALKG